MKKSLQITNELNDIITKMKVAVTINSITEDDGVSTINTESVTLFDNMDKVMILQEGMIITIDNINYPVSNIVNLPGGKSFDVIGTGLPETEWNIAANYKASTRREVNQELTKEASNLDRFPLIWLITPEGKKDKFQEYLDFTVDLVLVFAHKANKTDRTQKRTDENISPVIQPLLDLFELWMQSSDFSYMLEFFGHGKPIDSDPINFAYYGNNNKEVFTSISTDAIEVDYSLNFKKQFELPPIKVNYRDGIVSNAIFGDTAILDFEAKINRFTPVTFTINWGAQVGTTEIQSTLDNGIYKALQTSILIPEGVDESQTINITDNFGGAYSVDYAIESGFPAILEDGNTMLWVDFQKGITLDTGVARWADQSGNGNDLLQADPAKQPELTATGVRFNGIDNVLKTAPFTLEQPEFIYAVFKVITWVKDKDLWDGNATFSMMARSVNSSPNISIYAGGFSAANGGLAIDTYGIVRALYNGSESKLQINLNETILENIGTNDAGGFTLGARGAADFSFTNTEWKEKIIRKIKDTPIGEKDIYNYLAARYGFPRMVNFGIIGDSISEYNDPDWPINIIGNYLVNGHAVSGNSIISDMATQTAAAASDNNTIMVLALGTNDNEAGDMSALQTELEQNIAILKLSNPLATLYYMNVLPRWTDTGGLTEVDRSNIRAAILAACTSQSITCWDTYTVPWITSGDTYDGLHPSLAGGVKIWSEIKSRL